MGAALVVGGTGMLAGLTKKLTDDFAAAFRCSVDLLIQYLYNMHV